MVMLKPARRNRSMVAVSRLPLGMPSFRIMALVSPCSHVNCCPRRTASRRRRHGRTDYRPMRAALIRRPVGQYCSAKMSEPHQYGRSSSMRVDSPRQPRRWRRPV